MKIKMRINRFLEKKKKLKNNLRKYIIQSLKKKKKEN